MDVFGLVMSCADLVKQLYVYGTAVKGAQGDIQKLTTDLLSLSAVLNDISTTLPSFSSHKTYAKLDGTIRDIVADLWKILDVKDADINTRDESLHSPDEEDTGLESGSVGHGATHSGVFSSIYQKVRSSNPSVEKSPSTARSYVKNAVRSLRWPFRKDEVDKLSARLRNARSDIILCVSRENLAGTNAIKAELQEFHQKFDAEIVAGKKAADEARRAKLRKGLAGSVNQRRKMDDLLQVRHFSTGAWFRESQTFTDWLAAEEGTPQVLAVIGKSGAGKTSLLASAAHFAEAKEAVIAICFIAFNEPTSADVLSVLSILADQLSVACPSILDDTDGISASTGQRSATEMEQRIIEGVKAYERPIHLFVDAVNESRQSEALLEVLYRLVAGCRAIRLLYSSVLEDKHLQASMRTLPPTATTIPMKGLDMDIVHYIDHELAHRKILSRLSTELQDDIRAVLTRRAESSFRYVQCQIDHLSRQTTGKRVRAALRDLPSDMNSTYAALLARIPHDNRDAAREILQWLAYAYRPLSLDALCEVTAFSATSTAIDPEDRFLPDHAELLSWFSGLVAPAAGARAAEYALAHSSVRTFLTSEAITRDFGGAIGRAPAFFALSQESADRHLFHKALAYMRMYPFADAGAARFRFRDLCKLRPMTPYAAVHWARHAGAIQHVFTDADTAAVLALVDDAETPSRGAFASWVHCLNPASPRSVRDRTPPLYYLASYGLTATIPAVLARASTDVDAPGGRYHSRPVVGCVFRQQWDVARMLVDAGAAPPATITVEGPCVHASAQRGHEGDEKQEEEYYRKQAWLRQDLREHVQQLRALDCTASARGPACLRKVNVFTCGCVANSRPIVHVEGGGEWPLEELRVDIGLGCPVHDVESDVDDEEMDVGHFDKAKR